MWSTPVDLAYTCPQRFWSIRQLKKLSNCFFMLSLGLGLQGWPRLMVEVYQLDEYERVDLAGYGFCFIPVTPGHSRTHRSLFFLILERNFPLFFSQASMRWFWLAADRAGARWIGSILSSWGEIRATKPQKLWWKETGSPLLQFILLINLCFCAFLKSLQPLYQNYWMCARNISNNR